jgi:hypothetical protein
VVGPGVDLTESGITFDFDAGPAGDQLVIDITARIAVACSLAFLW